MKYNQPYGISDPNAPYINGNPSTGTMGSIPPAASIEYPQREIVNLISRSSLTPDNADVLQLARGVQNSLVNYSIDGGTASAYSVTLNLPPLAYYTGMPIRMKVVNAPTGPSTLNVNGLGTRPIKKRNGVAVQQYDFYAGDILLMVYDGTNFQIIGSQATPLLAAPMIYYVATTGNDANDGLTAGTAFRTIQKAISTIITFNLNGFNVTVFVANGTYAKASLATLNGSGYVSIIGNVATPTQCVISGALTSGGACIACNAANYIVKGFQFTTPGPLAAEPGAGVWLGSTASLAVENCNFGACGAQAIPNSYWIACDGGYVVLVGAITLSGGTENGFTSLINGQIRTSVPVKPTLTISNALTVGCFDYAYGNAVISNGWQSITGAGFVTGQKYLAVANAVIDSNLGGPSYLPGTVAGSVATGGQYV